MPTVEEYRANLIATVTTVFSDVDQGDPIPVALWAMGDAEITTLSPAELGDRITVELAKATAAGGQLATVLLGYLAEFAPGEAADRAAWLRRAAADCALLPDAPPSEDIEWK
jgi:hypothetical protein